MRDSAWRIVLYTPKTLEAAFVLFFGYEVGQAMVAGNGDKREVLPCMGHLGDAAPGG